MPLKVLSFPRHRDAPMFNLVLHKVDTLCLVLAQPGNETVDNLQETTLYRSKTCCLTSP